MGADQPDPQLHDKAQEAFASDATRFLVFQDDRVLCSSYQVAEPETELAALRAVFSNGRELAVRAGVRIQGMRYEVHRFDPPLVYGRTMTGEPVHSEAFALSRTEAGPGGKPAYALITFELPQLTARMVPKLAAFCEEHLKAGPQPAA